MYNLIAGGKAFFGVLGKYAAILPETFVIGFSLIMAIIEGFNNGFQAGFIMFVKQIFAAEYIINTNVTMAINQDPQYGFLAFMAILNGVLVIYVLTKLIYKYILVGFTGSTAPVSGFLIALLIVGVLEMAAIGWLEKVFFIPLKDGIIYLLFNLQPVFYNINWLSWYVPEAPDLSTDFEFNASSEMNS